jgi:predicted Zn-dependent protease
MGVLAPEFGHVQQRQGLRLLVLGTVRAGVAAVVFGDFSPVLAAAPAALGNASYSRAAEREADQVSAQMLTAAGLSPLAMVRFFEVLDTRFQRQPPETSDLDSAWSGISIASHPADAERIRFFRAAAGANGARP